MKTINVNVGSQEWHTARARIGRTSSMAPVIMGCGKKSRNELMRMVATGDEEEFSTWTLEVLFERGHQVEAMARPLAERIVGDDLAAITGTTDDDYLLASFDGIDMGETVVWECKQWNEEKAEIVRNGNIPKVDYWQCVHHLIVSGAEKLLYTVTDGTEEKLVHCYLLAEDAADDMRTLMDNWMLWDADLAAYVPQEVKPVLVGRTQERLPALLVEVTGMVTSSNLAAFKEVALAKIQGINLNLNTDQDFADAAEDLKWFEKVESSLEDCKTKALSQTQSIEELFTTVDSLKAESRTRRLALEKLVEARKKSVRAEILNGATAALATHFSEINTGLPAWAGIANNEISVDFAAAMKGKRSFTSMRDAVDQALTSAKIDIGKISALIHTNLTAIAEMEADYQATGHRDISALIRQTHCKDVVEARITTYKTEQKRKADELLAAERARIQKEEETKAQKKLDEEREEIARKAREEERKRNTEAVNQGQAEAAEKQRLAEEANKQSPPPAAVASESKPAARPVAGSIQPVERPATVAIVSEGFEHQRPRSIDIASLVASHYRVPVGMAIEWLLTTDFSDAQQQGAA